LIDKGEFSVGRTFEWGPTARNRRFSDSTNYRRAYRSSIVFIVFRTEFNSSHLKTFLSWPTPVCLKVEGSPIVIHVSRQSDKNILESNLRFFQALEI
jgi:hypothetical protein